MTAIASRPQVIEIKPEIRSFSNGNLMVCVKVALAARECAPQLFHDLIGQRGVQPGLAEVSYDVRLPATIQAPPAVALETEEPKSSMVRIVSAVKA
jgi:hypothetical protein